ncbi:response regulator transcription factor [Chryseomicrobium sp. FSL W7-1435]|uniref:response regulator transcription factor n=1 Tax=Chryseomicrobium sp. FSL W7-1435 TaxID=2921704 RepID=UPI00315AC48B
MTKILVVEDEQNIARFLSLELNYEGFAVTVTSDGRDAYELFLQNNFDVLLIDIMIPGFNGLELTRRVRKSSEVPILLVTARDAVMDKVSGLEAGADDYIVKPFAIEELLARIRAILRRSEKQVATTDARLTIDEPARKVVADGEEIELTKTEFDLLLYFTKNPGRVLTRPQIIEAVWGFDAQAETNVVDVYVRHLRKKLPRDLIDALQTVRGVGYKYEVES